MSSFWSSHANTSDNSSAVVRNGSRRASSFGRSIWPPLNRRSSMVATSAAAFAEAVMSRPEVATKFTVRSCSPTTGSAPAGWSTRRWSWTRPCRRSHGAASRWLMTSRLVAPASRFEPGLTLDDRFAGVVKRDDGRDPYGDQRDHEGHATPQRYAAHPAADGEPTATTRRRRRRARRRPPPGRWPRKARTHSAVGAGPGRRCPRRRRRRSVGGGVAPRRRLPRRPRRTRRRPQPYRRRVRRPTPTRRPRPRSTDRRRPPSA